MKDKYVDLIEQTFNFPQEEYEEKNGNLFFHGIDLKGLIDKYGTPFRFTYLPNIGEKINKSRAWFNDAIKKNEYEGRYRYSYCTKSSHFKFVLEECLKNKTNIETSSEFDLDIVMKLFNEGLLDESIYVLCNGFKTEGYVRKIDRLLKLGFDRIIPIIDNFREFEILDEFIDQKMQIGIRIASEEDPKFEFYTSRLGIGYKDIVSFYKWKIRDHKKFDLKMLHFFVNTGIRDNAYYWNELRKFVDVFVDLSKNDAQIDYLNIGGGFPVKNSLGFEFDYPYMCDEIVAQIKIGANSCGAKHPDIFTEFGSFTVSESGGVIYSILDQKPQNDKEKWNMIDGSFMTTLPDSWAINRRFVLLPINRWHDKYERVFLGGLTCDSDDYYNSEQHINAIYLPRYKKDKTLYVGFFNCGAYQESISGFGGIKHCLIPSPKYILIDKNESGEFKDWIFREEQKPEQMLDILGY